MTVLILVALPGFFVVIALIKSVMVFCFKCVWHNVCLSSAISSSRCHGFVFTLWHFLVMFFLRYFCWHVSPTLANCRKCSKTSFKSHADVFSGARDVYAIHELYMRAAKAQPSVRNA